ncbi:MAG: hypothetical protein HWN67_07655 [Candidatus Helarchaeota archaeon]|nr:hypothetical protein [Candidatus Helarchaeota archaeon]
MKLIRLRSVANNALRPSMWNPEAFGYYPFEHFRPRRKIIVDLISGTLTPDMEGDDVERYYKLMSKWFHEVLKKEGIPIDVIESATITITPEKRTCVIIAQGRTFSAERVFS